MQDSIRTLCTQCQLKNWSPDWTSILHRWALWYCLMVTPQPGLDRAPSGYIYICRSQKFNFGQTRKKLTKFLDLALLDWSRVARFSWYKKCTKLSQNIPEVHKIYQMSVKYTICVYVNIPNRQNLPLQDPPKFTQIRFLGLKTHI
jgi:hypothetical protein